MEATADDVAELVELLNAAYLPVESTLYDGPRTSRAEVGARLARGTFLIERDRDGRALGCVYVEGEGERGYLGMFAIRPDAQGRGLGLALMAEAERLLAARGVRRLEIEVLTARPELVPFYERRGFRRTGERPFDEPRMRVPCRLVVMEKALRP